MWAKLATLSLLKIEVSWIKGYDVIAYIHDVTNKILSHDSSYIIDLVLLTKFGNSSISVREVIKTSNLWGFDQKDYIWGMLLIQIQ